MVILRLKVCNFELVTLTLEVPESERHVTAIDKGVKSLSNWWVKRMNK